MKEKTENIKPEQKKQPQKRKKGKKPLATPSYIIRIALIWCFVVSIYLLSSSYISTTLYITEDLQITTNPDDAYAVYSSQEEIDNAKNELQAAIDGLVENKKEEEKQKSQNQESSQENNAFTVSDAKYEWNFHVQPGVDYQPLIDLINQARSIKRSSYTDETVQVLNDATLKAQKTLIATVTISKTALELMLDGGTQNVSMEHLGFSISSIILVYLLGILPLVGLFAAIFDKALRIKFIAAILCSVFAIADIFMIIYPLVTTASVMAIFLYMLIFALGISGIYAFQQEHYIITHPELEPEFTEKHPHFVKALINYKSFSKKPVLSEKAEERLAAKNAKQKRSKKK